VSAQVVRCDHQPDTRISISIAVSLKSASSHSSVTEAGAMAEADPETLLEWLSMGQGDERDMQVWIFNVTGHGMQSSHYYVSSRS
jgi:hypothetical protein